MRRGYSVSGRVRFRTYVFSGLLHIIKTWLIFGNPFKCVRSLATISIRLYLNVNKTMVNFSSWESSSLETGIESHPIKLLSSLPLIVNAAKSSTGNELNAVADWNENCQSKQASSYELELDCLSYLE